MRLAYRLVSFTCMIIVLALILGLDGKSQVYAQTSNDPWSPPVNLSHSGSTSNPVAIRDSNGITHVIWQDKIAGNMYARLDANGWSQPVAVKFPFRDATPRLVADGRGAIHAFWIDQNGSLAYTRMNATSNSLVGLRAQILAKAVLAFDVTVSSSNSIQLAYVWLLDTPGSPAGIYYSRSDNGGGTWTQGKLLYPSRYFRGQDKETANISIAWAAEGENTRLYVAWDNRSRKRVFFSKSPDNGNSWSEPIEIQGEDASVDNSMPYGIEVGAFSDKVLLLWQNGDPTIGCRQLYQWSEDGGENWTAPATMPTDMYGCPQKNSLLSDGNLLILLTSIQDQLYMLVWNGNKWSTPQFQHTLTGFVDPETQEMVLYACQNPILLPDGQMFIVGCDGGTGGDIWATQRSVSDIGSWFPPPPVWIDPLKINEGNLPISSLELIADSRGRFHAIWIQPDALTNTADSANPKDIVYYSGYDGSSWSRPINVLSSPGGSVDQPSITVDAQDRLMMVWREPQSGTIYFSWANAAKAGSSSEWANPLALPIDQPLATSPMVTSDRAGKVYVVFAVPINEGRGIFITTSEDAGQTWSKPVRVVDAVAAGWEMVDQPQIAISADNRFHLTWKVLKVVGENVPLGVYYTYSDDGTSWLQPVQLVESPIYWYQMASSADAGIQLVWQENTLRGYELKQQVSLDEGQSWSRPETIMDVGTSLAPASLVRNQGGQLFLMIVAKDQVDKQVLRQWTWMGDKWSEDASMDLANDPSIQVTLIGAAAFSPGKLGAVYVLETAGKARQKPDVNLLYSERRLQPGAVQPTPVITQTLQVIKTITPTVTATVANVPTQTATPMPDSPTQPAETGRSRGGIIAGVALVVIIIGVAAGLIVRVLIKRRSPG